MFDAALRARGGPGLDRVAGPLARAGLSPEALTAGALIVGVGACVAAGARLWGLALALWLLNRLLDGLDGPLARRRGATELGGLLDFSGDFVVYSGFVVGVAVAHPGARLACVTLLAAYLVNNVVLLGFSSMVERLGLELGDERSLRFTTGLAEGAETIVVYTLFCLLPGASTTIAWAFAGLVALTALQRVLAAVSVLGPVRPSD
ncbi:MAG TPA: CDP-alcohol phosphatidyltransferase family protein [Solirubrobacteraceae bacterium]|nr:CDP-alcohol phosphatidyltransferase family protein [Solirubrobacteraceae bacterium]